MSANSKPRKNGDRTKPRRCKSRQRLLLLPVAYLLLGVAACGGDNSASQDWGPAPPELQGSWVTVLQSTGENVSLVLAPSRYTIQRGADSAQGGIGVLGGRIQFKGSNLCAGIGTYGWSINGNSLEFGSGADPCQGRSEVLNGQTYNRGR